MLNYEKTLVIVVYRRNNEGLVKLDGEKPVVPQVRHVAQTPIIAAVITLRILSLSDISCVHDSKIRHDHY